MGIVTDKDMRELRIASAVFTAVALVFTGFRLYVRRNKLWWDDWCAVIALIGIFCVKGPHIAVTFGVLTQTSSASLTSKIAINYILAVGYVLELWFARASILCSILRITPYRRWVLWIYWILVFFALCGLIKLFLYIGFCEAYPQWKRVGITMCFIRQHTTYFQIATAFISDVILVILPILILRLLTSYPSTRQTLMLLFSASALITITQVVHTILTVKLVSGASLALSTVGFVAVLMCNIPVLVMATFTYAGSSTPVAEEKDNVPRFNITEEFGFRSTDTDGLKTKLEDSSGTPHASDSSN